MCARLDAHVAEPVGGFTDASIDGLLEAAAESPAGFRLLFQHALWPPLFAAQWLIEQITGRAAGEYFTRRQLPLVQAAGFQIVESERLKAGTVERIHAVKPA